MGDVKRVSQGAVLPNKERIAAEVASLRDFVDNFNHAPKLALRNGLFRQLDSADVFTTRVDGWEFGYKLEELPGGMMRRKVFVKVHDTRLSEVDYAEMREVLATVFDAALDTGAPTEIEQIAPDCMMIQQAFQVMFWQERNPNLIVPGNPNSRMVV